MEKILIVDDSSLQAANLRSILEDEYEVSVVQTARDGFEQANSGAFSLILLDVVMPEMDGFTLLKKLQDDVITQSVPVILITSLSDIKSEQRGLMLGAVDYISKPFHPLIVKARVNTHIKLYSYRRWNEAIRLKVPFSVCMFDIDHFKKFNDTFGHPAGDKVIASVARTLSSHLQRSTDFLARYGGEEFVAFLMGESPREAFEQVKKIRQAVEALHIPHDSSVSEWVTVSVGGVSVVPRTENAYSSYLKIADNMLYDAKKSGRNRVVWSDGGEEQLREKED